jgi:tyrosyl-tRNA synthetase
LIQDYAVHGDRMKLSRIIVRQALAKSKAEAERLLSQGAVEWDRNKVTDAAFEINISEPGDHTLRVGKKAPILVRILP